MWIVHLLGNIFTRIRFTLFSMFSCLKYLTELLVFTSRLALRLVLGGSVMNRVNIDPKHKGGSVHMAVASVAINRGVPIDLVLNTGRWAS